MTRRGDQFSIRPALPARSGSAALLLLSPLLTGCAGAQSALDPAGEEAASVFVLLTVMVAGAVVIWAGVIGLLVFALRRKRATLDERGAGRLILWGGVAFPSVTLLLLLCFALWLMPALRPMATAAEPALRVEVAGHQFWWRVTYRLPDGTAVEAANELRLPVGRPVELALGSADVIHSLWIPALAGKMDMIPGRTNRLPLRPLKTGTYRAPCAEYCGTSHALMAFSTVVMDAEAFDAWLQAEAQPSPGAGAEGGALFVRNGCGACHRVDGTEADGRVGPDLSHVGSRLTLGAGIMPNTAESLATFIAAPDHIKPGSKMPGFAMLPQSEIAAMAAWLKGLE